MRQAAPAATELPGAGAGAGAGDGAGSDRDEESGRDQDTSKWSGVVGYELSGGAWAVPPIPAQQQGWSGVHVEVSSTADASLCHRRRCHKRMTFRARNTLETVTKPVSACMNWHLAVCDLVGFFHPFCFVLCVPPDLLWFLKDGCPDCAMQAKHKSSACHSLSNRGARRFSVGVPFVVAAHRSRRLPLSFQSCS